MSKLEQILKVASSMEDRRLARKVRVAALEGLGIIKSAQDSSGILSFDNSRAAVDFPTRQEVLRTRGGEPLDRNEVYNLSQKGQPVKVEMPHVSMSLSTRYSPDRVGVQAARVSDGVTKDPFTGKVYDWREGFNTESGEEISGGSVELQSKLHY
jgi:hypothetical protein